MSCVQLKTPSKSYCLSVTITLKIHGFQSHLIVIFTCSLSLNVENQFHKLTSDIFGMVVEGQGEESNM